MGSAVLVRVEGVLVRRPAAACSGWMALASQRLRERALRLGGVAAGAALGALGGAEDGARAAWAPLRGTTEDRLVVLGEEYWALHLEPGLDRLGLALVDRAVGEGRRVVLLSEHPDLVVEPLRARWSGAVLLANRLEFREGRFTGRLRDPVWGVFGGARIEQLAAEQGLDLRRCSALAAHEDDAPLLAAVGDPCAVRPERGLLRLARGLGWPVREAA